MCCHFEEWFCTRKCKAIKSVLMNTGPVGQGLSMEMNTRESPYYLLTGNIKTLHKTLPFKLNLTLSEIIKQLYFS